MSCSVSIEKYLNSPESLRNVIKGCGGFKQLHKDSKVMIKPNLPTWDNLFKIPPFGVFTTTRLVEDLVILLKEFGCNNISIGEGSVITETNLKGSTEDIFKGYGYVDLSKKYNIKLIDFNKSSTILYKINDDIDLNVAKEAVESDFFIDFPVLKTHSLTKVSLGIKNLKGCIDLSSKRRCHQSQFELEENFQYLPDIIKPSLTIIDGIYALEYGAFHFGNAYKKDIIIASRDILAADIVAAEIMGFDADDIQHLKIYAKRHNKSIKYEDYEINAELIENHKKPLKWDLEWREDNSGPLSFDEYQVQGVSVPKYDKTLCTGCTAVPHLVNIMIKSAKNRSNIPLVEILSGKKKRGKTGFNSTVLIGACSIKANKDNPDIHNAVKVNGCPPKVEDIFQAFIQAGIQINEMTYLSDLRKLTMKYKNNSDYKWDYFSVNIDNI